MEDGFKLRLPLTSHSKQESESNGYRTGYNPYYVYLFNVQGSMHCKYITFDIFPTRCNVTQFNYSWKTALHVSGGIFNHHQEYTQLYLQYLVLVKPLLLPVAIVEELELV